MSATLQSSHKLWTNRLISLDSPTNVHDTCYSLCIGLDFLIFVLPPLEKNENVNNKIQNYLLNIQAYLLTFTMMKLHVRYSIQYSNLLPPASMLPVLGNHEFTCSDFYIVLLQSPKASSPMAILAFHSIPSRDNHITWVLHFSSYYVDISVISCTPN